MRAALLSAIVGVTLYVLGSPFLAVAHECLVLIAAELLGGLDTLARNGAVLHGLPLDPVYTGALLLTLGGIKAHGVAVAEPVGGLLALAWPAVFEPARLVAPGAWVSAVVAPGATIVSRWAATLVADAALLAVGVLVVRLGARRPWLALVGVIVQAQVVAGHLVDAPPDLVEIEAAGVPFALAMILSGDVQAGPRLAEALHALPPAARDAILGTGMVMLAYLPIALILGALWVGRAVSRTLAAVTHRLGMRPGEAATDAATRDATTRPALASGRMGQALSGGLVRRLAAQTSRLTVLTSRLAALGLAAAVALSPLGDLTDARTHYLAAADVALPGERATVAASLDSLSLLDSLPPVDSPAPPGSLASLDPLAPVDAPAPVDALASVDPPEPVEPRARPASPAAPVATAPPDLPAPPHALAPAAPAPAGDAVRSGDRSARFVARGDDWATSGTSRQGVPASGADVASPPDQAAAPSAPTVALDVPATSSAPTPAPDVPAAPPVIASADGELATTPGASIPPEPSAVAIAGSGYRYAYVVNGTPEQVRGMGYNVRYGDLSPEERARRLDRDFALLRRTGVNTVFGWESREFDEVLLDTAQRHGLGVAPPFELAPDAAYDDPEVRAQIEAEVVDWVERYRAHPAVRMWAIGNEVLHKLVNPSWMPTRSDPKRDARARAFGRFYATLLDRVHALDPRHPVVYRDAEDAYVSWMRAVLAEGPRRPWFIYGVNVYTPRLTQIVAQWPSRGFDVPLLVSEFAPGGMTPADRPAGFRSMWATIDNADRYVLGGSVYAWTTDGPEEVDRVFGLTNGDGRPVSGVLATLAGLFRAGEPAPDFTEADVAAADSDGDG